MPGTDLLYGATSVRLYRAQHHGHRARWPGAESNRCAVQTVRRESSFAIDFAIGSARDLLHRFEARPGLSDP